MKLLTPLSVFVTTLALSSPVFAQQATKNVVVSAALTSVCRFTTSVDLTISLGTYVAFQSAAATNTGSANIECTRHTNTPTLTFDTTVGLISGLTYTVAAGAFTETAVGAAPNGTDAAAVGTPRTGTVTVTASIPAGQAGSGAGGATAVTGTKVLTVAF